MLRTSLGILAILCTMFLAPFAEAQKATDPDRSEFENLCAPVPDQLSDQETDGQLSDSTLTSGLTHQQLEAIQIELLERGWVADFTSDDATRFEHLRGTVAGFQEANNMPATADIDAQTLNALGIPNPNSEAGTPEVIRAKPSPAK